MLLCADSAMANQEPELCYEGVRMLELLAKEQTLHRFLVKSGTLAPLTKAAGCSWPQAKSFAARALANLATTSDEKAGVIHRRLVDAGSYTALVEQVADSHPGVSAHAAKAAGDILEHGGEPAQKVLSLNIAAALLRLLVPLNEDAEDSKAVTPCSVAAVGALAALGSSLPDAIGVDGCQRLCTTAGALLSDTSPAANLSATKALAEVAKLQSLEDVIAEDRDNRSVLLCGLLSSKDGRVRTSSAQCLANLALHPEYAQVMGRRDTVGPLLHSLAPHVEVSTRQEASRAVSNLAANRESCFFTSHQAIQSDVSLTALCCATMKALEPRLECISTGALVHRVLPAFANCSDCVPVLSNCSSVQINSDARGRPESFSGDSGASQWP
jgi:hypothetical protein